MYTACTTYSVCWERCVHRRCGGKQGAGGDHAARHQVQVKQKCGFWKIDLKLVFNSNMQNQDFSWKSKIILHLTFPAHNRVTAERWCIGKSVAAETTCHTEMFGQRPVAQNGCERQYYIEAFLVRQFMVHFNHISSWMKENSLII